MPAERAREASRAAELMGVRLFHVNLADSSVSEGGATIAEITRVIEELSPDTIYTPSAHDFNQDHRNVHHATIVAARRVPRVFCYQSRPRPSSSTRAASSPVDEFMDRKLAVIRSYTSQVKQRRYLDAELLRATSRYWSRYGHSRFVEPFEVARDTESDGALDTRVRERRQRVARGLRSARPAADAARTAGSRRGGSTRPPSACRSARAPRSCARRR